MSVETGTPRPPRRLLRGTQRLQYLIGTRLLVGITVRNPDGLILRQEQFCGRVLDVADGVVTVDRDGVPAALPAEADAYDPAQPGRYILSSSGDEVIDPDYVTTWDVVDAAADG